MGRATGATVPYAKAKEGTDPAIPVIGGATFPAIATQEARVGGELGVAIPTVGRRQGSTTQGAQGAGAALPLQAVVATVPEIAAALRKVAGALTLLPQATLPA